MLSVGLTAKETGRNVSGRRSSTSFMNKVRYDPAYHSLQHCALNPIFVPRLTSNCDLDSDVDKNVKRHEVDRLNAQYLLVRALLHQLVLWQSW